MYASPAAAAAAPAAAAAAPAPYISMDEPQYSESLDEAKVYVTVPKVGVELHAVQVFVAASMVA
jgi:hypothetical protein